MVPPKQSDSHRIEARAIAARCQGVDDESYYHDGCKGRCFQERSRPAARGGDDGGDNDGRYNSGYPGATLRIRKQEEQIRNYETCNKSHPRSAGACGYALSYSPRENCQDGKREESEECGQHSGQFHS